MWALYVLTVSSASASEVTIIGGFSSQDAANAAGAAIKASISSHASLAIYWSAFKVV